MLDVCCIRFQFIKLGRDLEDEEVEKAGTTAQPHKYVLLGRAKHHFPHAVTRHRFLKRGLVGFAVMFVLLPWGTHPNSIELASGFTGENDAFTNDSTTPPGQADDRGVHPALRDLVLRRPSEIRAMRPRRGCPRWPGRSLTYIDAAGKRIQASSQLSWIWEYLGVWILMCHPEVAGLAKKNLVEALCYLDPAIREVKVVEARLGKPRLEVFFGDQ